MKWVYLSEHQRQAYINWLKVYKKNRSEIDLFEHWIQKDKITNIEDFIPATFPQYINEIIIENKNLIEESLKDSDPKIQIAALYYIIWYPDKFYIPTLKAIHFENEQDETFRKYILEFLTGFKPEEANLPFDKTDKPKKSEKKSKLTDEAKKLLSIDLVGIEIGLDLIKIVDKSKGGGLLERINGIRRQFAVDLGLIVPPVRIRDNTNLDKNEYLIKIKNNLIGGFKIYPDKLLMMRLEELKEEINSEDILEPAFNLPAKWIDKKDKEKAEGWGCTVVEAEAVLITHLKEIIKKYGFELLTRQDVQGMVDHLKQSCPVLINGIIPEKISVAKVHRVLQNLLKDRISIRNAIDIFELLGDHADSCLTVEELTEAVKKGVSRFIFSNGNKE